MLRKNPELRPSASELLTHPHLQPYVLKVHLKLNSLRCNNIPIRWSDSNFIKKTRFLEQDTIGRRRSFSNDRALNPGVSGTEQDSLSYNQREQEIPSYLFEKFTEFSVGIDNEDITIGNSTATKYPTVVKTPRVTPAVSVTQRKHTIPAKKSQTAQKHDLVPILKTPARKSFCSSRRESLPLSKTLYTANVGLLRSIDSPDISVNSPRIDKIAEFALASSEDPFMRVRGTSSTSAKCSSSSMESTADLSITKDKCTVQILDKVITTSNGSDQSLGLGRDGGEFSEHNCAAASTHLPFDSRQRKFDTSSFRQRAEALEGLLEFSARLLHNQRYDELGVLLKPFGTEEVSPRETAIWLAKSFKETQV